MVASEHNRSASVRAWAEVESRASWQLYEYWQRLRGEREFSLEEVLDPEALGDLWDDCFLVQLRDIERALSSGRSARHAADAAVVPHYNYAYLGANILGAYESGRLPVQIPGIASLNALHLAQEFRRIEEDGQPRFYEAEHRIDRNRLAKFRQCLLPLGNRGGCIVSILGGMRFCLYEEAET